jgi:hypothetical protein
MWSETGACQRIVISRLVGPGFDKAPSGTQREADGCEMTAIHWIRLSTSAKCGLRLGAWYRADALTAREAHVSVRGRLVKVPRSLVEIRLTPPTEWTVVCGPLPAVPLAAGGRDGYLVCPNCRYRDALPESRVSRMRCTRCNEVFPIAWGEPFPPRGQPVASRKPPLPHHEPLRPDHRMTRRRSPVDRRRLADRRSGERRVLALAQVPVERRVAVRRAAARRRTRDRRDRIDRRQRVANWKTERPEALA